MEIKKGIGVSPGVVISTAFVLDSEDFVVPKRHVPAGAAAEESRRFDQSLAQTIQDISSIREQMIARQGQDIAGILDFHIGILRDRSLIDKIHNEINSNLATAEYAVSIVMRQYAAVFSRMNDHYLSERVKDVHDVERQLLRKLIGQKRGDVSHLENEVILIAHDMLPSQAAVLDRQHVRGFATDAGGRTSHTAIVARAMGIPAVVGLGDITAEVGSGQTIILDGDHGVVIIDPDEPTIQEHRETDAAASFENRIGPASPIFRPERRMAI